MPRFSLLASLVAIVLSLSACSREASDRPPLGIVKGSISLDGSPFAGAFVTFVPDNGRPSVGTSDAQGNYVLQYSPDVPGAALGKHQVRIMSSSGAKEGEATVEKLPSRYNFKSTLTADVTTGENQIDFKLQSK